MATYRIDYADGTRDIQTVANKMLLRFDSRNGRPTPVKRVKRIADFELRKYWRTVEQEAKS